MLRKRYTLEEVRKRINDSYELKNNVLNSVPDPLVSVYVPTYQHVNYIRTAIESILMQETTFPFELIVGEDFSTDGTREITFEYATKYPDLIRLITADYNVKQQANQMRCLMACRGKYVAICSGDDYWTDPLKLQKQADFLEANNDYSMCYHPYQIKRNGIVLEKLLPVKPKDFSGDELIATPHGMPTFTKMVRNVFQDFDLKKVFYFHGDYPMNALMGTYGKSKFIKDIKPGIYLHHEGGTWTSMDSRAKKHDFLLLKMRLYRQFLEINDEKSALISLESLRIKLVELRYSENNRNTLEISKNYLRFFYRGVRLEFHFHPISNFFKKNMDRLKRKRN